jgi:predicted nucleic acid-binding protein
MRVFLDTNIVLDVLLNRPTLVSESEAVILRCEALDAEVLIAWHGLATAYYLLRRGRSEADALGELDRILAWAQIATATDTAARRARTLGFRDFEDGARRMGSGGRAAAPIACPIRARRMGSTGLCTFCTHPSITNSY